MSVVTVLSPTKLAEDSKQKIEQLVGDLHELPKVGFSFALQSQAVDLASELRQSLFELSDNLNIDIIATKHNQQFKLAVFDMDSTLIQAECIDLIAESVGVGKQVSEITEAAMRGELDFTQSLEKRVGLLNGVDTTIYQKLMDQIQFMPGALDLAKGLKQRGVETAVLSGGFVPIAQWVQKTLEFTHAHANTLSEKDGKLTGKTEGSIVDGNRKAELLQQIAKQHNIPLDQVIAVGDGSNDLPMMGVAGFGVAFKAKPIVQRKAPGRLNSGNLSDLLYLF